MSGGLLTRVDRVTIAVADLARGRALYERLLGRVPAWQGRGADGTPIVRFALANSDVELVAGGAREGLAGLGLACADAAAAHAALAGAATLGTEERVGADGTRTARRAFRLDAAAARGLAIDVLERGDADATPASGDDPAAVAAVDHVVVRSGDADAVIALFGARLGIRLALDRTFPDWGMRLVFFRLGDATLEIASPLDGSAAAEADSLWGVSWRVGDVAAAHARLAAAGVATSEIRRGRRAGTRVFTVHGDTASVATLVLGPDAETPRAA